MSEKDVSHTHRPIKEILALVTSEVFAFAGILYCCKNIPGPLSSLAHQPKMACGSSMEEDLISRQLFRPLLLWLTSADRGSLAFREYQNCEK